ncbi:MAG: UvrD-helicase domain-containing protein [Bdellovibrionaceae bacterium]|nr:UvrD-helicase domain-containing protein [Pseudobdellovibrionaceae bacterium]
MSDFRTGLNPEQVKAVEHRDGPLLILAGAGSGKTTVLVNRAGYLIASGVPAKDLTVLTFTNKAARELKHRVGVKLGKVAKGIWAGTFHSFGLQILRQYHVKAGLPERFGIIDQTDSQAVLKDLMKTLTVAGRDKFDMDKLLTLVNDLRLFGKFKSVVESEYQVVAEALLPKYLKRLNHLGAVDFEGLLLEPLELLKKHPDIQEKVRAKIGYLMVDEFQDTNATQMKLIDAVLGEHRNLCVVGDDDQSIYGFRGAEVSNILNFPKRYAPAEVIRLERNYRSSGQILNLANAVIAKNSNRHGKVLRSEARGKGSQIPELFRYESEEIEAETVARELRKLISEGRKPRDLAVLYRSNSQAAAVEAILRQEQVPYSVSGGTSIFDRKEIKDVLAYLRAALFGTDLSVRRILNTPSRGIGETSFDRLDEYAKEKKVPFMRALQFWQEAGVNENTGAAIDGFVQMLHEMPDAILTETPAESLLQFLDQIGYRKAVYDSSTEASSGEKKWNLIGIFARIMERRLLKDGISRGGLSEFIDQMELRDDGSDSDADEVSLMTFHASKGLEFPVVYLIGVEEDLLPHRTLGQDVDEERRLFYVGITRAQEKLILSYCQARRRYGAPRPVSPSRFLLEIDQKLFEKFEDGVRPWTEGEHEKRIADFLNSLTANRAPKPTP